MSTQETHDFAQLQREITKKVEKLLRDAEQTNLHSFELRFYDPIQLSREQRRQMQTDINKLCNRFSRVQFVCITAHDLSTGGSNYRISGEVKLI